MSWIQTGSTICFKPYTLEEALRGLSEAGFENGEIGAVKGFLEHLDPAAHLAAGLVQMLAVLARHQPGEPVELALEQGLEDEHAASAPGHRQQRATAARGRPRDPRRTRNGVAAVQRASGDPAQPQRST